MTREELINKTAKRINDFGASIDTEHHIKLMNTLAGICKDINEVYDEFESRTCKNPSCDKQFIETLGKVLFGS